MQTKSPKPILAQIKRLEAELAAARKRIHQLEAQIETDPVLAIPNRRGFERELNRAIAHLKRYQSTAGLLFLDLNNLKTVNDSHGHLAGDAILKAAVTGIHGQVRRSDVVGRFGGDEFTILLWNVTKSSLRAKAKSLETMIAALRIPFAGEILRITACAGMTMLRSQDDTVGAIARADADMYVRKCNLLSRVAVDP